MKARRKARTDVTRKGFLLIPFWEAVFEYLLATASRRSEMLSLTWENTHLDDNAAFYPDTKNGRSRTVPVRQHVVDLLRKLPRDSATARVFPITGDELEGAWTRICKRAGIKNYHIHDNRHESLSRTAETGRAAGMPFDIIALAAVSGHRDLRMLARYSHLCAGELAQRMDEAYELAGRRKTRKGRPMVTSTHTSIGRHHHTRLRRSIDRVTEDAEESCDNADQGGTADRLM